ncbi:hypothetical protein Pmani_016610 [Petrolisthes manimaculis]|uniref:Uncharacterized protein n=1 Tax=Petrolisthes manimaculis TaxID=1843537 RepID=A0AAE1PRC7_9EUCA|nr:hypothetical protein Pmani_016610 [Petrolisthes manimaculis]
MDRPRCRMVNTAIIFLTSVLVFITFVSAFISGHEALDLFFVLCIILICGSHLTVLVWYRNGDLDPKFLKLIYFNAVCIILICICGNIMFHSK